MCVFFNFFVKIYSRHQISSEKIPINAAGFQCFHLLAIACSKYKQFTTINQTAYRCSKSVQTVRTVEKTNFKFSGKQTSSACGIKNRQAASPNEANFLIWKLWLCLPVGSAKPNIIIWTRSEANIRNWPTQGTCLSERQSYVLSVFCSFFSPFLNGNNQISLHTKKLRMKEKMFNKARERESLINLLPNVRTLLPVKKNSLMTLI